MIAGVFMVVSERRPHGSLHRLCKPITYGRCDVLGCRCCARTNYRSHPVSDRSIMEIHMPTEELIGWYIAILSIAACALGVVVGSWHVIKIAHLISDNKYTLLRALYEIYCLPFTSLARLTRKYERLNRRHDRMLKTATIRKDIVELRGRIMEQALKTPKEYLETNQRRNQ